MAKLKGGKRKKQESSKPEGWLAAGIVVPLELTVRQEKYARRCVGVSRFVYNLAVSTHRFCRRNRLKWPSAHEMEKEFNSVKGKEYPFVKEVSKFVAERAFRNFDRAMSRWRSPEIKSGPPVIKHKNRTGVGSFLAGSGVGVVKYDGNRRIKLPYLGSVRMARTLPQGIIPHEVTIKKQNGLWYASIAYWKPPVAAEVKTHDAGGVDVGINPLAVDSDGQEYQNPKAYYNALRKLRRWQRALARRADGSSGWWEAQRRIDRIHRRITGIRNDAHNQVSRALVKKYSVLGIETLNVAGMDKLRWQAKAIRDAAIGGLLAKIRYKAEWYGSLVVQAAKSYPSSKLCSVPDCGYYNAALKRESEWTCPSCGTWHDRNHNAAGNLHTVKLALSAEGGDVMLPDGKALAVVNRARGETGPDDGRTTPEYPLTTQLALAL